MLTFIVFSIVFLITVGLFILTYRNIIRIRITPIVFILSVFFVLLGVVLIFIQFGEISTALSRHQWPITTGTVIETKVVGERAFNPEITCKYKVNNTEHILITDLSTPGFGRKRSRQSTARIIINEYPIGSAVQLFYNPINPDEAYIRIGPYWANYMQLALGLLLYIFGMSGVLNHIVCKFVKKKNVN